MMYLCLNHPAFSYNLQGVPPFITIVNRIFVMLMMLMMLMLLMMLMMLMLMPMITHYRQAQTQP